MRISIMRICNTAFSIFQMINHMKVGSIILLTLGFGSTFASRTLIPWQIKLRNLVEQVYSCLPFIEYLPDIRLGEHGVLRQTSNLTVSDDSS